MKTIRNLTKNFDYSRIKGDLEKHIGMNRENIFSTKISLRGLQDGHGHLWRPFRYNIDGGYVEVEGIDENTFYSPDSFGRHRFELVFDNKSNLSAIEYMDIDLHKEG